MSEIIKKDFGDWLSPILVKEIRQGIRSRVFVSSFLLIQGLMIFCVVLGLVFAAGDFTDSSSVYFWIIISLPLLLLMPCLGFGALGNEIKDKTMELLFLTRLSAWRIVAGKWTAIFAQTLLIVCSILPYMVLRYFIGGINLLADVQALCWSLFASALFTGVTISVSPFFRSTLAKFFLAIITVVLVFFLIGALVDNGFASLSLGYNVLIALVLGPLFLLLMFQIAVARIAPPAENHSFRERLLGLIILGAIALLNKIAGKPEALMLSGFILLLPVCITALCEEIKLIPSIYLPFVKRGAMGRFAGVLFYPGWPSGLLFTLFACALYFSIFFSTARVINENTVLFTITAVGGLIMPLAVTKLFFGKQRKTLVVYFSLQVFMFIAFVLTSTLENTSLSSWMKLVSPLPTSVFFLGISERIQSADRPFFIFMSTLVLILSLIVLLAKSVAQRKQISICEKIARDTLMKPRETETAHANAA